jgi:hypothetical protein
MLLETHAPGAVAAAGDDAPAARTSPRWLKLLAFAVPVLVAVAVTRGALNGDVHYVLGGLRTAGEGGAGGPAEIFVARPLAYRLLIDALDNGRALVTDDGTSMVAQRIIRAEAVVLVAAVSLLLYAGLRRHLRRPRAMLIAYAAGVTLAIAPPFHFLEPDWAGALAATAAVGGALVSRYPLVGMLAGGTLLWLAVAMKVATAPYAVLALGIVAVFSWRRAVLAGGLGVGMVGGWMYATRELMPWESMWLHDMISLVRTSPLYHGLRWEDIEHLTDGVLNAALVSPIVVLLPASLVVLVRSRRGPWRRLLAAALAVAAVALAVGPAYGQGEWFQYHFAGLPVLAAGCWAAAVGVTGSNTVRWVLVLAALAAGLASALLLPAPTAWRNAHFGEVSWWLVAAAAGCALLVVVAGRLSSRPGGASVLAATAVCLSALVGGLPGSALSFAGDYSAGVNRGTAAGLEATRAQYARLHAVIGKDTPVLYLTYGAENFMMGNPTACRYPSPQWLQRGTVYPYVRDYASYRDNARCITEDTTAQYLVVAPKWFRIQLLEPALRDRLLARFDCSPAKQIHFGRPSVHVCPLRQ